jgi:hypothetical protein
MALPRQGAGRGGPNALESLQRGSQARGGNWHWLAKGAHWKQHHITYQNKWHMCWTMLRVPPLLHNVLGVEMKTEAFQNTEAIVSHEERVTEGMFLYFQQS